MYNIGSSPTVTKCILWDNTPHEIFDEASSSTTVNYSDVRGGWPGAFNINADPCFVDAAGGSESKGNLQAPLEAMHHPSCAGRRRGNKKMGKARCAFGAGWHYKIKQQR
jgi:hypothetical protein